MVKEKFDSNFYVEFTKNLKNDFHDESRDVIGKSKEVWNWLVHPSHGS